MFTLYTGHCHDGHVKYLNDVFYLHTNVTVHPLTRTHTVTFKHPLTLVNPCVPDVCGGGGEHRLDQVLRGLIDKQTERAWEDARRPHVNNKSLV